MNLQRKKHIIHIHTDIKFVSDSYRFFNKETKNSIFVIGNNKIYKGEFEDSISYFNSSRNEFKRIVSLCNKADMVVVNDLNFPKSYIANRLSRSVVVVWRFFGVELYSKIPNLVYSEKTKEILDSQKKESIFNKYKNLTIKFLIKLKYRTRPSKEIHDAIFKRVDYFLGLSINEYNFLKNIWPDLPEFFQLNFKTYSQIKEFEPKREKLIILGNNKSAYNNHSEVLDLIEESKTSNKYKFLMFYNYGQNNFYSTFIKSKAIKNKDIRVIEEFLSMEDFNQIYSDADALVLNGYRQMAMGNIWEAIRQNTKIYLNENNLIYTWLKDEDFLVFSMAEFKSDLENNNTALNSEQALSNQKQMIAFTEKYNIVDFHKSVNNLLTKKSIISHIHTDLKFINGVGRFNNPSFDNQIIVLGQNKKYDGPYKEHIQFFDYTRKEFLKIIELCNSSDIVVLYGLNFQKSYIANRLPKSVKVIWRFFGSELYNLIPEFVFSKKTLCILDEEKSDGFILAFKKWLRVFSIQIKYRAIVKTEIKKAAFERTDIFLGIFKNEYEFLKNKWPELPPYMQIGIPTIKSSHCYNPKASNKIILGNNRSAYNNHLDILDCIDQAENKNKYKFLMFYNYGFNNHYTETVRNRAAKIKEVEVIEDFMSLDKFNAIYEEADAFVMNGRRQMALGNVWEAIQRNTKLYLNEKNITYTALIEEGFVVFTIKDFIRDIENNAIKLTAEESIINQKNLQLFSKKYDVKNFHCSIENLIDQKL